MNEYKKSGMEEYSKKIYASQLVTIDDLQELRKNIVNNLMIALKPSLHQTTRKLLKSHEVRKMLNISPGTLAGLCKTV